MLAKKGIHYQGTCPAEEEAAFLKTYSPAILANYRERIEDLKTQVPSLGARSQLLKSELILRQSQIP